MRNLVTKVIRVEGTESAWNSDSKNYTVISLEVDRTREGKVGKINMDKITGPDLHISEFIDVVLNDFDILKDILNYLEVSRKENFFVDKYEGVSGCVNLKLFTSGFMNSKAVVKRYKRAEFDITCFDKVDLYQIKDMWIGDLIELLIAYNRDMFLKKLSNTICASKKDVRYNRRKAGISYIRKIQPAKKLTMSDLIDAHFNIDTNDCESTGVVFHKLFDGDYSSRYIINTDSRFRKFRKWIKTNEEIKIEIVTEEE